MQNIGIKKKLQVKLKRILCISPCIFFLVHCPSTLGRYTSIYIPRKLMLVSSSSLMLFYITLLCFMIYFSCKIYFLFRNNLFFPLVNKCKFIFYFCLIIAYLSWGIWVEYNEFIGEYNRYDISAPTYSNLQKNHEQNYIYDKH